jgi:hypothetical protein
MYPTLVLTDGREHPYARQGDLDKCHLNSNGEPGGGGTCHRKAATPSSMAMLSGPAVIVSRAATRTTAAIVIGPAAAVVDTNFFCHRPTPRRVGRNGTVSRGVGNFLGAEISLGYVDVSTGSRLGSHSMRLLPAHELHVRKRRYRRTDPKIFAEPSAKGGFR